MSYVLCSLVSGAEDTYLENCLNVVLPATLFPVVPQLPSDDTHIQVHFPQNQGRTPGFEKQKAGPGPRSRVLVPCTPAPCRGVSRDLVLPVLSKKKAQLEGSFLNPDTRPRTPRRQFSVSVLHSGKLTVTFHPRPCFSCE